jgi:hypothetical protein
VVVAVSVLAVLVADVADSVLVDSAAAAVVGLVEPRVRLVVLEALQFRLVAGSDAAVLETAIMGAVVSGAVVSEAVQLLQPEAVASEAVVSEPVQLLQPVEEVS